MELVRALSQSVYSFAATSVSRLRICALMLIIVARASVTYADTRVVFKTANDWVYHGTTETFSQATAGLSVEWQGTSPIFAGVEAHQAITPGVQQRHRAVMTYIGYSYPVSDQLHGSATFARRFFPGAFKEWDYNEVKLELAHSSGWSARLDYAADYYDHETEALVGEFDYTRQYSDNAYWYASAGVARLGASQFRDYEFAKVGAGFSKSRFNLDVSYGWNSENNQPLFGLELIRSPEWLLQLSYQIY